MSNNLMVKSSKDQFLHWRQDMERKQKEQARKVKELQNHVERLQRENDQLQTQIGESRDPRRGIINKAFFKAFSFNIYNSPLSKVQIRLISCWHLKSPGMAVALSAFLKKPKYGCCPTGI